MIVVSDTSVLSCLAEIGELELLHRLYGVVTINETVWAEARDPRAPERLRDWLASQPPWVMMVSDPPVPLEQTHGLDDGEASSITLAWQHRDSCLLLIDERRGRATGAALGLRMTGAAGVLTDAATSGWVDFEDVFRRLGKTRFRLAEAVVETLRQRFRLRSGPP